MSTPPPPSYSSPIPSSSSTPSNEPQNYPSHPAFKQRKSSTIITFADPELDNNDNKSCIPTTEQDIMGGAQSAIPNHMRSITSLPLSRSNSNTSSLAEEGELEPSLPPSPSSSTSPSSPLVNHIQNEGQDQNRIDENTGLISGTKKKKWYEGPYFVTAVKFSILFTIFTAVVVVTFYFGMPKLDESDKKLVKLPRSFADLQALNTLFQKYKTLYPFRILACAVVTYLFIQTFTLPGSMYISILFGAAYGMLYGLVLCCLCDAFGSLLCYTLSSLLAPPLLTMPFYRARVETWRIKIMGDPKKGKKVTWDSVFAFLLVLRIAPFPPHWVANFVAPHLGIGMFMFWSSCFIGIAPVSVIHVTIGSSLDSMTSAADFHILSLRNILGLLAVVVAVLIPVGLKRVFKKDLGDLGEAEEVLNETSRDEREINVPAINGSVLGGRRYHAIDSGVVLSLPSTGTNGQNMGNKLIRKGKGRSLEIIHDEDEDEDQDDEEFYENQREQEMNLNEQLRDAQETQFNSFFPNEGEGEGSTSGTNSPQGENQYHYQIYDPSGQIQHVQYNPTISPNRSRSNSKLNQNQRPKSGSRSNTTNTLNTIKNYGAVATSN